MASHPDINLLSLEQFNGDFATWKTILAFSIGITLIAACGEGVFIPSFIIEIQRG